MHPISLEDLAGTRWNGINRLWLDPEQPALVSDGTMTVEVGAVHYTWAYEGKPHAGSFVLGSGSEVTFTDTWHQAKPMACERAASEGALLSVRGSYPTAEGPPWGWRTIVSLRDTGELVLQMINVTPWGEEAPAVQLVATRAS